jgi:hypothetical protein
MRDGDITGTASVREAVEGVDAVAQCDRVGDRVG